jgi:hypothetical protein
VAETVDREVEVEDLGAEEKADLGAEEKVDSRSSLTPSFSQNRDCRSKRPSTDITQLHRMMRANGVRHRPPERALRTVNHGLDAPRPHRLRFKTHDGRETSLIGLKLSVMSASGPLWVFLGLTSIHPPMSTSSRSRPT